MTKHFDGFSLPDGAWMPPELMYLLPWIRTASELKCALVAIYHSLQVGGAEPLTLSDFQRMTGIKHRASIIKALQGLTGEDPEGIPLLEREAVGRSFQYHLRLKSAPQSLPSPSHPTTKTTRFGRGHQDQGITRTDDQCINRTDSAPKRVKDRTDKKGSVRLMHGFDPENEARTEPIGESLRESEREILNLNNQDSLSDSLNYPNSPEISVQLLKDLRTAGVYLKTGQWMVQNYPETEIRMHMAYYEHAMASNIAQGPGYLVMSIKEGWGPPLGFKSSDQNPNRYIDGNYADFIEH